MVGLFLCGGIIFLAWFTWYKLLRHIQEEEAVHPHSRKRGPQLGLVYTDGNVITITTMPPRPLLAMEGPQRVEGTVHPEVEGHVEPEAEGPVEPQLKRYVPTTPKGCFGRMWKEQV